MSQILEIIEEPGPDLSHNKAFVYLWFYPAATFRFLLKHPLWGRVQALLILGACCSALKRMAGWTFVNLSGSVLENLLKYVLLAIGIFASYLLFCWLLKRCSTLFGKRFEIAHFKLLLAYALLPTIVALLLLLPKLFLFGASLFTPEKELTRGDIPWLELSVYAMEFVLFIWSALILVRGLQVLLKLPAVKALLILVISLGLTMLLLLPLLFLLSQNWSYIFL